MPTRYEIMKTLVEKEVSWSNGSDNPWRCVALIDPWFLDKLAFLAANAPKEMIGDLITACGNRAGEEVIEGEVAE